MEMDTCIRHPERETYYKCQKHNIALCEECLECRDPEIYCKFRTACSIWFVTKRKSNLDADQDETAGKDDSEENRKKKAAG